MKVLVIAGSHLRHRAVVNSVTKHTDIAGLVVVGRESAMPAPPDDLDWHLKELWQIHFERRDESEKNFFGVHEELVKSLSKTPTLHVDAEDLNTVGVLHWYTEQPEFDCVLILGVPIIRDPLFSLLPAWKVNLHMGLIPEYKGVMSPFFCHYFLRPHFNGCSFHVIDRLVDTGQILHQTVPKLVRGDWLHDSASRSYLKACSELDKVLMFVGNAIEEHILPTPDPTLPRRGKLFTKKDWHPALLTVIYDLFRDHIVDAYLDGALPSSPAPELIEIPDHT